MKYTAVRKKILGCGTLSVSTMLTEKFKNKCKEVLLKKYRRIKKWERLDISSMTRLDTYKTALTLLAEKDKRYQEILLKAIDKTNAKECSKRSRKTHIEELCRKVPHKKSFYSIENLIEKAMTENKGK